MKRKLASWCLITLLVSLPLHAEQEVNTAPATNLTAKESEQVHEDLVSAEVSETLISSDTLVSTPEGNVAEAEKLPQDLSPLGMYQSADIVVKTVMILLFLASLATWSVWVFKTIQLRVTRRRAQFALKQFIGAKSMADATVKSASIKGAGLALLEATNLELELSEGTSAEGIKERLSVRLDRVHHAATQAAQKGVNILATTGSIAPFVGLFGTVWGIMGSFIGIAESQTTNLAVVAPGIAEALLATAMGLVAAIPAVIFYNHFSKTVATYRADLADIVASLLILVSRDLDHQASRVNHGGE